MSTRLRLAQMDAQLPAGRGMRRSVCGMSPPVRNIETVTGFADVVLNVAFSPDGRVLVGRSWDSTIRLWNTETGEREHFLFGHTDDVDIVAFSPDGRTLASGSQDDTVRLWDVDTGAHLKNPRGA